MYVSMKILLISSGYLGIYPYLEKSIQDSLSVLGNPFITITPEYNLETIKQIESFQPDFVLAFVGYKIQQELLQFLKQKGYILGIWLTEDPFYIDESIRLAEKFQYIFTIDLGAYEYYEKIFQSKKIYHLPLGTEPSIYYPLKSISNYFYDLCLVGYPYPERIQLANHILEQTPYKLLLAGPLWRRFIKSQHHKRLMVINKWIEPSMVNQLYHLSKIVLNSHRSINFYKNKNTLGIESKSINNRTFDIAACGGFQLLSAKQDTESHFDLGNEIISYSTDEECIKFIHKFINDDQERTHYSKKAMERVLDCHTFFHRLQKILSLLG
jgi:spore maturation protein CgeB